MQNKSLTPSKFQPLQLPQSPVSLSPNKNLTGSARVIRDIVADIYNNIQNWNNYHIKGSQAIKRIILLKSENINKYSNELEDAINDLYVITKHLNTCKEKLEIYKEQILALSKTEKRVDPVFISLTVEDMVTLIETVVASYSEESKVKNMVLEHTAHVRNADEAMFFAASWTLQPYITNDINLKMETLLVETGHRKFI
ncbi:cyclin-dependent kinase 2-interacting protein-like [Diorhabda sublineata]|uniref:cyclin-dependent kinase 2-interacting protein-like n=1 Tax=Diorhabda sublineata TaxID=1163346 RepID=UPI0024E0CFFD|nr:cyclin-dependent kinase 2-interacting protein-like [Diorhabda sublineata]